MGLILRILAIWVGLSVTLAGVWISICYWPRRKTDLEIFQEKLLRQICEDLRAQGFYLDPKQVQLEIDEHSVRITLLLSKGDTLELPLQLQPSSECPGVTHWVVKDS